MPDEWIECSKCSVAKPASEYYRAAGNRTGLMSYCKACKKSQVVRWAKTNPEKVSAYRRTRRNKPGYKKQERERYREKNPDKHRQSIRNWKKKNPHKKKAYKYKYRAKLRANAFSFTHKDLIRLDRAPCFACNSRDFLTLDHLIPVHRSGTHSIGNLHVLCVPCNSSKNNMTWSEWKYSKRARARLLFPGLYEARRRLRPTVVK